MSWRPTFKYPADRWLPTWVKVVCPMCGSWGPSNGNDDEETLLRECLQAANMALGLGDITVEHMLESINGTRVRAGNEEITREQFEGLLRNNS